MGLVRGNYLYYHYMQEGFNDNVCATASASTPSLYLSLLISLPTPSFIHDFPLSLSPLPYHTPPPSLPLTLHPSLPPSLSLSLSPSLPPSLLHSPLPSSLPLSLSLPPSLSLSPSLPLAPPLPSSLPLSLHSLPPSLPLSLLSLPPSLPLALPLSLPPSLPPSLQGWGCAYRSLQTLWSWFVLQGYTDSPVPTHQQIQETLVKVGDKEQHFIGSKEWIGSFEVGTVLDQLLGVSCLVIP